MRLDSGDSIVGTTIEPTSDTAEMIPEGNAAARLRLTLRTLAGFAAAHFVNDIYASFLAPLLPLVVTKFNLTLTLAGLLATIFTASSALSQPLFAILADRMPRRTLVALGPTLTVVGMGLLGLAPSYLAMVGVLLIAGIGTASFHPAAASSAGTVSQEQRGLGVSLFVTGGELGFSSGPIVIALVVSSLGLGSTALVAVPGLLLCLGLWWFVARQPTIRVARTGGLHADLRRVWRSLAVLYLIVVCRSIIITSYVTFLPLLIRVRGGSLIAGGAAVFLLGGMGALGGLIGGILSDRFGRRGILLASFLLGAPMLLIFIVSNAPWAYVFLALGGFSLYLSAAVTIVMGQDLMPRQVSVASSIVMGLAWGTAGLALTGVGALADAIGLAHALTILLALAGVALAAGFIIPKPQLQTR